MSWVKLDDTYDDNPKVAAAGPLGQLLHVKATLWCARNLTDGRVPYRRLELLAYSCVAGVVDQPEGMAVSELIDDVVEAGLIDLNGAGPRVHDFLDYNPSRKRVLADREAAKKRAKRRRGETGD